MLPGPDKFSFTACTCFPLPFLAEATLLCICNKNSCHNVLWIAASASILLDVTSPNTHLLKLSKPNSFTSSEQYLCPCDTTLTLIGGMPN
ncbi:unnamed protein product [Victoria cruziana]